MEVKVVDFRHEQKNTRQGYFTLVLDGVMVKKCVAHKHPGGKVWFAPPAIQRPDGGYENVVQLDSNLNEQVQLRVAEELQRYISP